MRHSGIVPLVHNSDFRDDSGDTHLNLMRPIRDRETGDVRRRSGAHDVSALRAEKSSAPVPKRPRWIAATAAALLVGGAAAAALTMSGSDNNTKGSGGHSQTPAGSTSTGTGTPPGPPPGPRLSRGCLRSGQGARGGSGRYPGRS